MGSIDQTRYVSNNSREKHAYGKEHDAGTNVEQLLQHQISPMGQQPKLQGEPGDPFNSSIPISGPSIVRVIYSGVLQVLKPSNAYGGHHPMIPVASGITPSQPQADCGPMNTKLMIASPAITRTTRSTLWTFCFMVSPGTMVSVDILSYLRRIAACGPYRAAYQSKYHRRYSKYWKSTLGRQKTIYMSPGADVTPGCDLNQSIQEIAAMFRSVTGAHPRFARVSP